MNHHTTADFWDCYDRLPQSVQKVADRNYELLRAHPPTHLGISSESVARR